MLELFLSPEAENDLEIIYKYTYENWGLKQADYYQDQLYNSMSQVCKNPNIGRVYEHSDYAYKIITTNKHLVFYRITNDKKCIVVRILHERMDLDLHIIDRSKI